MSITSAHSFLPHEKHFLEGQCHRLIANDRCEICFVISRAQKYSSLLFFSLARLLWHSWKSTILLLSVVRLRVCILSTKRLLLDMNFAELWHHQNSFSDFKVLCSFFFVRVSGLCACICIRKNSLQIPLSLWHLNSWHYCNILCPLSSLSFISCLIQSCHSLVLIERRVTIGCYLNKSSGFSWERMNNSTSLKRRVWDTRWSCLIKRCECSHINLVLFIISAWWIIQFCSLLLPKLSPKSWPTCRTLSSFSEMFAVEEHFSD